MSKVALKISNLADAEADVKAQNAVTNCSGTLLANPTPPEVGALNSARSALAAAIADQVSKQQAAQAATEVKKQKRADLETKYAALGNKVQAVSGGDAAIITARGFDVVSAGAPVMMGPVTGMMATPGVGEGKVDWMCDPQKGAFYLLQTSPDVMPRVWTNQEPSKKSSGTLSGLTSLTRLWVRAAAKGANNTGGWSDPALVNVP